MKNAFLKYYMLCSCITRRFGAGLVLFLSILLADKASAQVITLHEVLDKIEKNNLSLLSYQNKVKADDELVKGAGAWMAPQAGLEWDQVPYQFDYTKSQLLFSVMQGFPNPKKIDAKAKYLGSVSSIEKNEGEFHKVLLFAYAKQAYYARYISERRIAVLEENIKLIGTMIAFTEKQVGAGKAELPVIYKLKGRQMESETMLIHERNAIRTQTSILNYLMNADLNASFSIDSANPVKNYRGLDAAMKIDSLDNKRSDVMKMNSEINTMKLDQALVSTQARPDYGARFMHYSEFGGRPDMFAIMGTITIPIAPWSAKGYKSEVKSMNFRIAAMEQDKENLKNSILESIKMNLIELESEYKELDNYTLHVIPAYKRSLDAGLLSYGQNTSDITMTLFAWDDLQSAQMEYLKHLDMYLKIQTEYEKELQIQ